MFCTNCGHKMPEDARFCTNCGHSLGKESRPEESSIKEEASATAGSQTHERQTTTNEYVEKGKAFSKGYWDFFVKNIKKPTANGENQLFWCIEYGAINMVLFPVFIGLGFYFELKKFSGGFGVFRVDVSFNAFFDVFLWVLIAIIFSAVVLFLLAKLTMNTTLSIQDVFTRFGALCTVPVALSVIFFVFSLLGTLTLANDVALLILASMQIVIISTYLSIRKTARSDFDVFYGLLIFYAVFYVFVWITKDVFPDSFYNAFFQI